MEHTHLLCVEPTSQQLFSINLGTHQAEEVALEKGQEITNKIKREEYKMQELLDREEHYTRWFFQNETAQTYRRQMVPFYLLELEANMYPVYVDNSNIDESLTHDFKISEIIIKISDTIWESYSKQDDSQMGRYSESQAQHLASGQKRNNARAMTALAHPKKKGLLDAQDEERKGLPQSPMLQPSGVSRGNISREAVCEPLRLTDVSLLTTADKVIKRCEKDLETRLKGRRDHLSASKM